MVHPVGPLPNFESLQFDPVRTYTRRAPAVTSEEAAPSSFTGAQPSDDEGPIPRQERRRSPSPDPKRRKGHKPLQALRLKPDGSNWDIWIVRLLAAFRFNNLSGESEILDPSSDQLARDILLDCVDDALVKYVCPRNQHITAFMVLTKFRDMFAMEHSSYQATLISKLWTLAQSPGEAVQEYGTRAMTLLSKLENANGDFPAETFLLCFGRGLSSPFKMTFKFLQQGSPARMKYQCLLGDLLAEEASIEHEAALQKNQGFHGAAGAVTEAARKPWRANNKPGAPGAAGRVPREQNPNCWNCNQPGHVSKTCPQPQVRPWPFQPATFTHKNQGRLGAPAAKPPAA